MVGGGCSVVPGRYLDNPEHVVASPGDLFSRPGLSQVQHLHEVLPQIIYIGGHVRGYYFLSCTHVTN